jgi:hypothetical protein
VVQGAHFVTDCVWSLGVIWLVASALYYFVLRIPAPESKIPLPLNRKQKRFAVIIGAFLSFAIILAFLTRRPFFETYYFPIGDAHSKIHELRVGLKNGFIRSSVRYSKKGPILVLIHARGFASTRASETPHVLSAKSSGNLYQAIYQLEKHGYFSELTHEIEVVVPIRLKDKLTVIFADEMGKPIPK